MRNRCLLHDECMHSAHTSILIYQQQQHQYRLQNEDQRAFDFQGAWTMYNASLPRRPNSGIDGFVVRSDL